MVKLQNWFYKYNGWSYTKHRLWGDCKRAYYFNYIGAALDGATDINVPKIKQLKKLESRFVIQGKIIHEIIEKWIRDYQNSHKVDENLVIENYIQKIETYRAESKNVLIEYFNGLAVNQLFFDRARENGQDQLSLFFGLVWPQITDYQYLQHEEFDNFVIDGVKAIVKIDYVCKASNGQMMIYDWKTGSENEEYENDLQVGAYALWAVHQNNMNPEQVTCNLVYLTSGEIRSHKFTSEQLNDLKLLIKSDFKEMNHNYEQANYPASPVVKKCTSCHFATVCTSAVFDP